MKIIAVVGTGSGCGKTTVACSILRSIPGLGAVKISPRDGPARVEWGAGAPGKDTDLFVGSGAAPVARIVGPRDAVVSTWERIKAHFDGCRGVVVEGAGALAMPEERFAVFVVGDRQEQSREERNAAIAARAQVVVRRSSPSDRESLIGDLRAFLSGAIDESHGRGPQASAGNGQRYRRNQCEARDRECSCGFTGTRFAAFWLQKWERQALQRV